MERKDMVSKVQSLEDKIEAAKLYHRGGHLQKAESIYREVLKEDPSNSEVTHLLGLLAMQVGKFEIAEHLFNTALELDKGKPEYYANLGVLYYLKGDFEKAKDLLEKALELDKNYIEAHANLGKIYAEENNLEQARIHLVRAVNMGDTDISSLITLAEVNYRLELYDRAEDLCKQMLDLGHEEDQIYEILIESICKQDRPLEAIPFAEVLVGRDKEKYTPILEKVYKQAGMLD